jgi:hypothetical protein
MAGGGIAIAMVVFVNLWAKRSGLIPDVTN